MTHERRIEELSAYLDGEAERPAEVERLIAGDPEATREYEQLRALSRRLQAMPEPVVHPGFTTRVMAEALEPEAPRLRSAGLLARGPSWAWHAWAAAALLLIAAGGLLYAAYLRGPSPEDPSIVATGSAATDPDVLWAAAALEWTGATVDAAPPWEPAETHTLHEEDLFAELAGSAWFESLAAAVDSHTDIEALLGGLNETEVKALERLLVEYLQEETWT